MSKKNLRAKVMKIDEILKSADIISYFDDRASTSDFWKKGNKVKIKIDKNIPFTIFEQDSWKRRTLSEDNFFIGTITSMSISMQNEKFYDAMVTLEADRTNIEITILITEEVFNNPEKFNCTLAKPEDKIINKNYAYWEDYPSDIWKIGNTVSINVDTRNYRMNGEKIYKTVIGKILGISIQINNKKQIKDVYIKTKNFKTKDIQFFTLEPDDYLHPEKHGCFLITSSSFAIKK